MKEQIKYISNCPYLIFILNDNQIEIKDFNNNRGVYPISMGILNIVTDFGNRYYGMKNNSYLRIRKLKLNAIEKV